MDVILSCVNKMESLSVCALLYSNIEHFFSNKIVDHPLKCRTFFLEVFLVKIKH